MPKVNLKTFREIWVFIPVAAFLLYWINPVSATTYYINPGESIQAVINDPCTVDDDEIEVAPGTYYEAINFNGKAVRLYSSDGPEVTIIDANGLGPTVVTCDSGEGANTILEGFTVTGGTAHSGGGMLNEHNSSPTVTNCTFIGNTATSWGGGMLNGYNSSPTVTNCKFSGNTAEQGGGGMYNYDHSSPTVTNCTFSGNSAGYGGGGMFSYYYCSPTITNCTFSGNITIAGNLGGGICSGVFGSPTVTNCILWGNMPDEIQNTETNLTVTYSDVQGGTGETWFGQGCIDADPQFQDADGEDNIAGTADDNLRLSSGSPCIDAGSSTPLLNASILYDLDGKDRYVDIDTIDDTGFGPLEFLDMGAYEFICTYVPGDINCDGKVDFEDLAQLCNNWLAGTEQ